MMAGPLDDPRSRINDQAIPNRRRGGSLAEPGMGAPQRPARGPASSLPDWETPTPVEPAHDSDEARDSD